MTQHWQKYGRHYYQRHGYEGLATDTLRNTISTTPSGTRLSGKLVTTADYLCYTDPVNDSISAEQGIRLVFADQSRIVYRLSGAEGAALRVYLEVYEPDRNKEAMDTSERLTVLAQQLSQQVAHIAHFTGREAAHG